MILFFIHFTNGMLQIPVQYNKLQKHQLKRSGLLQQPILKQPFYCNPISRIFLSDHNGGILCNSAHEIFSLSEIHHQTIFTLRGHPSLAYMHSADFWFDIISLIYCSWHEIFQDQRTELEKSIVPVVVKQ
jgi:hypothetical protein